MTDTPPTRQLIEEALPEVTVLMEQRFAEVGGVPEPGSDLDQIGLRDGANVVKDWLGYKEAGLALEHLCYMVEETNLPVSPRTYASIIAARQQMQTPPWRWRL